MYLTDFKEAVAKCGQVVIEVFKVVLLGPPEAGKTQLASALVGDYHEVTESTPVTTGAKVVVKRFMEKEDSTWEPLSKDVFQQLLHSTASQLPEESQPNSDEGMDSEEEQSEEEQFEPDHGEIISGVSTWEPQAASQQDIHLPPKHNESKHKQDKNVSDSHSEGTSFLNRQQIFHELLKDVEKSCKAYDDSKSLKMRYIHMIDNGGQPAFFDAHPVFATSRATYLLVYNMEEGLKNKPKYTYRKKGQNYAPIPNETDTNVDIIKASLMTVISLKEKFKAATKHLTCCSGDETIPPLLLVVGTHYRDSMSESYVMKEDAYLCEECRLLHPAWEDVQTCPLFCEETKLFPVDSLNEQCEGVKTVRQKAIPQRWSLKMEIPIKWFHCHLLFWHAKEEKTESGEKRFPGLEVLQLSTLYDLCYQENLISDEKELLDMVRTFHVLGFFFIPALDLKQEEDWETLKDQPIFTNPDLIYGELTKILEVPYKNQLRDEIHPNDLKLLKQLKEEGELTLEVMTRLGIPDTPGYMSKSEFRSYLLEQLSRWGLAAKIPSEEDASNDRGPTYFIPCVLRPCSKPVGKQDAQASIQPLTIFLTVSESKPKKWYYVPNGVFTHFVVNLLSVHNKYTKSREQGVYCYRDSVTLIRDADKERADGVQYKYSVEVAFSKKRKSVKARIIPAHAKKMRPDDYQIVIWKELKVALEKACKFMYHAALTVTVATKCPCNKFGKHLAHLELCTDKVTLSCLIGEEEYDLPPDKKLMMHMLEAQPAGVCYVHVILLLA